MNPELLFKICNLAILPFWLLLAVLPRHALTRHLVHSMWLPCGLALLYMWMLFGGQPAAEGAGFDSLQSLMLLFQSPAALLAGWIHYLVFDLFIGAWQVRDAQRRGINHWLVLPCLLFTLMLGPIGLMLYLVLRLIMQRETSLQEMPA